MVNPAYEAELLEVESRCSEPCKSMTALPDPTKSRSRQLYGILSTVLKGRPLQVLRLTQDQHGYEVMRVLHQTFQPRTRSRAMAIITAIVATPAFNKQSTIREQVHAFEKACSEYLKASGKKVSEDVRFSKRRHTLRFVSKSCSLRMSLRAGIQPVFSNSCLCRICLPPAAIPPTWTLMRKAQ